MAETQSKGPTGVEVCPSLLSFSPHPFLQPASAPARALLRVSCLWVLQEVLFLLGQFDQCTLALQGTGTGTLQLLCTTPC